MQVFAERTIEIAASEYFAATQNGQTMSHFLVKNGSKQSQKLVQVVVQYIWTSFFDSGRCSILTFVFVEKSHSHCRKKKTFEKKAIRIRNLGPVFDSKRQILDNFLTLQDIKRLVICTGIHIHLQVHMNLFIHSPLIHLGTSRPNKLQVRGEGWLEEQPKLSEPHSFFFQQMSMTHKPWCLGVTNVSSRCSRVFEKSDHKEKPVWSNSLACSLADFQMTICRRFGSITSFQRCAHCSDSVLLRGNCHGKWPF